MLAVLVFLQETQKTLKMHSLTVILEADQSLLRFTRASGLLVVGR